MIAVWCFFCLCLVVAWYLEVGLVFVGCLLLVVTMIAGLYVVFVFVGCLTECVVTF